MAEKKIENRAPTNTPFLSETFVKINTAWLTVSLLRFMYQNESIAPHQHEAGTGQKNKTGQTLKTDKSWLQVSCWTHAAWHKTIFFHSSCFLPVSFTLPPVIQPPWCWETMGGKGWTPPKFGAFKLLPGLFTPHGAVRAATRQVCPVLSHGAGLRLSFSWLLKWLQQLLLIPNICHPLSQACTLLTACILLTVTVKEKKRTYFFHLQVDNMWGNLLVEDQNTNGFMTWKRSSISNLKLKMFPRIAAGWQNC